jgi:prepilin-type N-terminal cleavage/methylation domain-containing protein
MNTQNAAHGGFTLIEIMIVVAIIGLLATMAIQNYGKSREKVYQTTCTKNLQLIQGSIDMWALDLKKDSADPVTYSDISAYMRNSVVCPSGGTSFADSYAITTVDARPTCVRRPQTHMLPP